MFREPVLEVFVVETFDMVWYLLDYRIHNSLRAPWPLVILDTGFAWLLGWDYDLEGWESLDTHLSAEGFVLISIAIDSCHICQALKISGHLFIGWLQVLAVAAPWSVESEKSFKQLGKVKSGEGAALTL